MVFTAAPRECLPGVLLVGIHHEAVTAPGVVAEGFDRGRRRRGRAVVVVEFAIEIVSSRVRVPGDGGGPAREEVVGERT